MAPMERSMLVPDSQLGQRSLTTALTVLPVFVSLIETERPQFLPLFHSAVGKAMILSESGCFSPQAPALPFCS